MGQKTNPNGFRLGVVRTWDANWYDDKSFSGKLQEDLVVRNYVRSRLKKAGIARIQIDRTPKRAVITIHTSRPGIVIGKSGKEIAQLEEELKKVTSKEVKILIHEIKRPELDAYLVAEAIASQLEGRISFRRAMKQAITAAMRMGAEGIRVRCGGRLGGAEIARSEHYKDGRIPLQTIRADIDYSAATAFTIYGAIGVKVWICKGEILGSSSR
ncbi:MAG: 30S ribosomal protein S3 [Ignavibacteriales bacterium]|nr:30S ribosomal protein S3 [Ignavibacteriales bacterium]